MSTDKVQRQATRSGVPSPSREATRSGPDLWGFASRGTSEAEEKPSLPAPHPSTGNWGSRQGWWLGRSTE